MGMQIGAPTVENSMEASLKLKIKLPGDPVIPLLDIYPKKKKSKMLIWKDTRTPMFIAALFIIAKIWKQPKCSLTDKWIKKMWHIYTMEYCIVLCLVTVRPYGPPARLLCPWGFSRQEYWNGLPCPPPGDFPDPGIKPRSTREALWNTTQP